MPLVTYRILPIRRSLAAAGAVLFAVATILHGCGSRGPIVIGLAGPWDDPVGAPMLRAAQLAVREINADGGVGGRPLELLAYNDHADDDSALAVATALRASEAVAVIGHLYSGQTLAAAPIYNGGSNPVVELSPSSSSPMVSLAGDYTFRMCPSEEAHGGALARWVRQRLRLKRGAVVYLNDDYGRGLRQTFEQEFAQLGGELVSSDPYMTPPRTGPYLDRLAELQAAEFLIVAGNASEAEVIIPDTRGRGLSFPILGGDALEGIESKAYAEGIYETTAYLASRATPSNRKFVAAYNKAFPNAGLPNQPAAATYDAVYLLRDLLARAGTDRAALRDALAGVGTRSRPFDGVTGVIRFDDKGDAPASLVTMGVVQDGVLVPAGGL